MKKLLLTFLLLTSLRASALDWTYSTNLFWWITTPTNIFCGTNSTDPARDSYIIIWNKLNADMNLMWQRIQNGTNGGSGSGITNFVFTATNLPPGSAATVTNIGTSGGIAYYQIGVPQGATGAAGTNTVNYYNLSNAVVSSQTFVALNTNFNFALSNSIGKFTNIYAVRVIAVEVGGGGIVPPTAAAYGVLYSTNGTSYQTTMPAAPNVLWLSVTSAVAGAGGVSVTCITHPETRGATNDLTGQTTFVNPASDGRSPVTLDQMNAAIANSTSGLQNDGSWYYFAPNGNRLLEMQVPAVLFATNLSIAIDGTGTNWAVSLASANFVKGWQFQMSTNLALLTGFQMFTNYTLTTNSGIATFTVPMSATPPSYAFFRVASPQLGALKSDYAHAFNMGTLYLSNSWNLAVITNGMQAGDIITVNSNGLKLVDVWMSNSTPILKPHW